MLSGVADRTVPRGVWGRSRLTHPTWSAAHRLVNPKGRHVQPESDSPDHDFGTAPGPPAFRRVVPPEPRSSSRSRSAYSLRCQCRRAAGGRTTPILSGGGALPAALSWTLTSLRFFTN